MKISSILKLAPQIAAFCLIPLYAIFRMSASRSSPDNRAFSREIPANTAGWPNFYPVSFE